MLYVFFSPMTAFLAMTTALAVLWGLLFVFSSETRREQLIMSLIGLLLAPAILLITSQELAVSVAAPSPLSLVHIVFISIFFGIASIVYQALLGKHTKEINGEKHVLSHRPTHWVAHGVILGGIWMFVALCLLLIFSLSALQAFLVSSLLIGIYIIADRKDLLLDALLSAVFMAMTIFVLEQIFFAYLFPDTQGLFWNPALLSDSQLGGLPIEELLWAAVAGFALGPLYEYVRRLTVR